MFVCNILVFLLTVGVEETPLVERKMWCRLTKHTQATWQRLKAALDFALERTLSPRWATSGLLRCNPALWTPAPGSSLSFTLSLCPYTMIAACLSWLSFRRHHFVTQQSSDQIQNKTKSPTCSCYCGQIALLQCVIMLIEILSFSQASATLSTFISYLDSKQL